MCVCACVYVCEEDNIPYVVRCHSSYVWFQQTNSRVAQVVCWNNRMLIFFVRCDNRILFQVSVVLRSWNFDLDAILIFYMFNRILTPPPSPCTNIHTHLYSADCCRAAHIAVGLSSRCVCATLRNALQHTSTHRNTPQHTATRTYFYFVSLRSA